jgi:protein-L-isoaspartate(D-aspartate) O-methyltransferase
MKAAIALLILMLLAGCGAAPPTTPVGAAPASPPAPSATAAATAAPTAQDSYLNARLAMVKQQIENRGVDDAQVLEVMRRVPRHLFVPPQYIAAAYEDHPLPIGYGQTISQPYIVALMTAALQVGRGARVLEIGTGSGYQAAVLAELGVEVVTMEIVPELAQQAAERLRDLGYANVSVQNADGYFGWAEHAPYDAIIVTAAPDHLPQPLAGQLKEGGRLVIPIGPTGSYQTLWLFEKQGGELQATNLGDVVFVPLTGEH